MKALKAMHLTDHLYDLTDEQLNQEMTDEEVTLVSQILLMAHEMSLEPAQLERVFCEADAQYHNYKLKSKG